jgi:hypothetical protein
MQKYFYNKNRDFRQVSAKQPLKRALVQMKIQCEQKKWNLSGIS